MIRPLVTDSNKRIVYAIAGGAFVLRMLVLIIGKTYWYKEIGPAWGWETGWISRSLALNQGFASPFGGFQSEYGSETGPTAWIAPLYPALQALVFKVFGIQSLASAFVMRLIHSATAPAMCVLLYRVTSRIWNERLGVVAAFAWAIFPNSVWYDTCLMWDTILTTCVFFTFIDLVVSEANGRSADLRRGFLAGVLALLNPAVGTGVGACLLWRWSRTSEHRIRSMTLTVVMALAMITPWMVRNYVVFHKLIFIRGNFGHELYKGSNLAATGENNTGFNPVQSVSEFKRYAAMGEVAYVKADGDAAKSLIRKYPGWFFKLTRRRIDAYWNGPVDVTSMFAFNDEHLALKKFLYRLLSFAGLGGLLLALVRRQTYAFMFAGVVLLYPIIYYITFPNVRYRLPLEPILLMYGLYLASAVIGRLRRKGRTSTASSQEPKASLAAV